MERTQTKSGPLLAVRLDSGPKSSYAPGDTIRGAVYRTTPIVAPRGQISISLKGQSVCKLLANPGGLPITEHSEFSFFNPPGPTQTLLDGPLHLEQGDSGGVWPFAITIPAVADQEAFSKGNTQDGSYLPLGQSGLPLPGSFTVGEVTGTSDAFVEYFLCAELHGDPKAHDHRRLATMPVTVRPRWPGPPVLDFQLQSRNLRWSVATYRLIPGMQQENLSLSQRSWEFFHSSKVPVFAGDIQVDAPAIIQLESPVPVPFRIRAVPRWDDTSDIVRHVPQEIKLLSLSVSLISRTEVKCAGYPSAYLGRSERVVDLLVDASLQELGREMLIPCTADGPPLDVGELIGLQVGYTGRMGQAGQVLHDVYPSFTTFNIKHFHFLKWKMQFSVAGKKFKMGLPQSAITVLPPPSEIGDSVIKPPPPCEP